MTMKITYVGNKNTLILIQVCHATFPVRTVDSFLWKCLETLQVQVFKQMLL